MKLVIVQQDNGKYIFSVHEEREIKAGENLLLSTRYGDRTGKALCDSFSCEGGMLDSVLKSFSTSVEKMMPVIGKVCYERWKEE